jgi:hypothetical protein
MPIGIGAIGLRLTTHNRGSLPNVVKTALAAPGPVSIAAAGSGEGGAPIVERTITATNLAAYFGFSYLPAASAGEQAALANGAIVEGFTGCTQGGLVYPHDTEPVSHTANGAAIGIAVSASKIYFFTR